MLLFVFVGALFRFAVNKPLLDVLFQLPPRSTAPADPPHGEAITLERQRYTGQEQQSMLDMPVVPERHDSLARLGREEL